MSRSTACPSFTALAHSSDGNAALAGRIHIGPGIDYLEHAFDDSKYGEFSRAPYLDISIPSILDNSLAPAGKHVMSIYMQFAPYKLKSGDWAQQSIALRDTVIKTLAQYAPDFPSKILAVQTLTPQDLEATYGLTGGHPFHGELALDQIFTMRPLLGWARYATPVKHLYLCGNGTHPGNGVTGASGHNAAREILEAPPLIPSATARLSRVRQSRKRRTQDFAYVYVAAGPVPRLRDGTGQPLLCSVLLCVLRFSPYPLC